MQMHRDMQKYLDRKFIVNISVVHLLVLIIKNSATRKTFDYIFY